MSADEYVALQLKSSTLKRLIKSEHLHLDEIQCPNQRSKQTVLQMLRQAVLKHL